MVINPCSQDITFVCDKTLLGRVIGNMTKKRPGSIALWIDRHSWM